MSVYDAELDRGYPHFTYPEFYEWLGSWATNVVEVGSWKGFSTVHLAKNLDGWIHAVDVWQNCGAWWEDFRQRFPVNTGDNLYACFLRHIERTNGIGRVLPYRMPSLTAASMFRDQGRTFDAVFIDADHRYEAVKDDIEAWRQLVRPGGVLAGHDYDSEGVRFAVDEMIPGVRLADGNVWFTTIS